MEYRVLCNCLHVPDGSEALTASHWGSGSSENSRRGPTPFGGDGREIMRLRRRPSVRAAAQSARTIPICPGHRVSVEPPAPRAAAPWRSRTRASSGRRGQLLRLLPERKPQHDQDASGRGRRGGGTFGRVRGRRERGARVRCPGAPAALVAGDGSPKLRFFPPAWPSSSFDHPRPSTHAARPRTPPPAGPRGRDRQDQESALHVFSQVRPPPPPPSSSGPAPAASLAVGRTIAPDTKFFPSAD